MNKKTNSLLFIIGLVILIALSINFLTKKTTDTTTGIAELNLYDANHNLIETQPFTVFPVGDTNSSTTTYNLTPPKIITSISNFTNIISTNATYFSVTFRLNSSSNINTTYLIDIYDSHMNKLTINPLLNLQNAVGNIQTPILDFSYANKHLFVDVKYFPTEGRLPNQTIYYERFFQLNIAKQNGTASDPTCTQLSIPKTLSPINLSQSTTVCLLHQSNSPVGGWHCDFSDVNAVTIGACGANVGWGGHSETCTLKADCFITKANGQVDLGKYYWTWNYPADNCPSPIYTPPCNCGGSAGSCMPNACCPQSGNFIQHDGYTQWCSDLNIAKYTQCSFNGLVGSFDEVDGLPHA